MLRESSSLGWGNVGIEEITQVVPLGTVKKTF